MDFRCFLEFPSKGEQILKQKRDEVRSSLNRHTKQRYMTTLIGPRRAHKQEKHIFALYFPFPRGHGPHSENEQLSGSRRLGGRRGRATPTPCGLV